MRCPHCHCELEIVAVGPLFPTSTPPSYFDPFSLPPMPLPVVTADGFLLPQEATTYDGHGDDGRLLEP